MTWQGARTPVVPGQIILKFGDRVTPAGREAAFARHGLTPGGRIDRIGAHLVTVGNGQALARALDRLAVDPDIEWAEPNVYVRQFVYPVPNDPYYQQAAAPGYGQFSLVNMEADRAWNDPDLVGSKGTADQIMADVDTGVRYDHEDFQLGGGATRILVTPTGPGPAFAGGRIVGWDFANNDNDPMDDNGHGTHVGGIMGAAANNGLGVAGMTWEPKIMPVKVLTGSGWGTTWAVVQGLDFARQNGANVVNMSLGSASGSSAEQAMLRALAAEGIVLVAASGNNGQMAVSYPAWYPECIAVGSVERTDTLAYYSNYGPQLDVVATGEGMWPLRVISTWFNGGYLDEGGTSMASPNAAGVATLVLGQNPDWAPETVYRRLTRTADKVPAPGAAPYNADGWEMHMGYGRVNAYQALGGIATKPWYAASVCLRDSKTILSDASGTNPVARHVFTPATPGTVTFTVLADDRDAVTITGAVVEIMGPGTTKDTVPMAANPITSRLALYSVDYCAQLEFSATLFVPTAKFMDNGGTVTQIPLPAYRPAVGIPATIEATASPNPQEAGSKSAVTVVVRDASGNPIRNVPVSGRLVAWPGPGASLAPAWGKTTGCPAAFSCTAMLSSVEGNHLVVFSVSATGLTGMQFSLTITGSQGLALHKRVDPSPVCAGGVLTYTVSWSKIGLSTALNLVLLDTLPNGTRYRAPGTRFWAQTDGLGTPQLVSSMWATAAAGPWTPGEPADGTAGPLVLKWVVDRIAPGKSAWLEFRVKVSSTLTGGATVANRAAAWYGTGTPPRLSEAAVVTVNGADSLRLAGSAPRGAPPGSVITVTLTATNNGAAPVSVAPGCTPGPDPSVVVLVSGPSPPGPALLPPGGVQTFAWTWSCTAKGWVEFTLTATGTACPVAVVTAIQWPAVLAASLTAWPSPRNVTQKFLVALTVTNTGDVVATGVTAAAIRMTGPGVAALTAGPTPAMPVSLLGGTSVTFTWTYTAVAAGPVVFSTTVTATDPAFGSSLRAGPVVSNVELIQTPAALAGSPATASPDPVCVGGVVSVVLTVTNTGGATLGAVTGSPNLRVEGTGAAVRLTNPASIPALAGGASANLTWTYSPTAPGTLKFTATITALDANSSATVSTGPRSSNPITVPASGAFAVALAVPPACTAGQWITIALTVTNSGGAAAGNVVPALQFNAGEGLLTWESGPVPAPPVALGAGAAQTFVWTYSVAGTGSVNVTGTATGQHAVSGCSFAASATSSFGALSGAALTAALSFVPSPVEVGYQFTALLLVTNSGDADATGVLPSIGFDAGAALAGYASGPVPAGPVTIAAGKAQTFVWTYNALATGTVAMAGTATGTDLLSGGPVAAGDSGSVTIVPPSVACPSSEQWTRTYAGTPALGWAGARDVAYDSLKNVIVVGDTDPGDWEIRKFTSAGVLVWERTYDSPASGVDIAYGVAVDSGDNIVVCGIEDRPDLVQGGDWRIRKYDSGGTLLWSVSYASPGWQDDVAYDVAVEGADNVVVAGMETRYDLGTETNWLTRKYDSAGALLWSVSYTSEPTGFSFDTAYAVAVDGSGNSVVAGEYFDPVGFSSNALVLKYDSSGTLLWSRTYDGPLGQGDAGFGVAVDPSQNVIVAGYEIGPSFNAVWRVCKYDGAGQTIWTKAYAVPGQDVLAYSAASDAYGNVIVLGIEDRADLGQDWNWRVRKYDPGGNLVWEDTYDSPAHDTDDAWGVATAPGGVFALAGTSWDIAATDLVVRQYGPGPSLSAAGSVAPSSVNVGVPAVVTLTVSNTGCDTLSGVTPAIVVAPGAGLVSLSSGPVPASVGFMAPGASATFTWTYDTIAAGTATFTMTASGIDVVTAAGLQASATAVLTIGTPPPPGACGPPAIIWSRTYNNVVNGDDDVEAVAMDAAGNVIVGGREQYAGPSFGWLLRKFDANGNVQWTQTYRNAYAAHDFLHAVAVNPLTAAVVAVGMEEVSAGNFNWMIRKYDSAGIFGWAATYTSPGTVADSPQGVAVDASGNVYAVGHETRAGQSNNWLIRKYTSAGGLVWSVSYNGAANGADIAWAVAVDPAGNPVVAGQETVAGQGMNWLVRKYDTGGNVLWNAGYNGAANGDDVARGVACDPSGSVYVAGYLTVTGQGTNWIMRKYAPGGALLWTVTYNGAANGADEAYAVCVDGAGDAVVAGMENVTGQLTNWLMRMYGPGGTLAWSVTYNNPSSADDALYGCAVSPDGLTVAAGGMEWRNDILQAPNWLVRKYVTVAAAHLAGSAAVTPSTATAGDPVEVVLTVTNTGCDTLTGVTPAIVVAPGAALVSLSSGPVPASIASLAPGSSASFTWTYSTLAAGTTVFTLTASGTDTGGGGPVAASGTAQLQIFPPAPPSCAPVLSWSRTFNDPVNGTEVVSGVAMDGAGNAVIAGWDQYAGPSFQWRVRRYDPDGNLQWDRTYKNAAARYDFPYAVAIDAANGDAVVAGREEVSPADYNWMIRRYDLAGNLVWSRTYSSAGVASDESRGVAVDAGGNAWVAGWEAAGGQGLNVLLRKYSNTGALLWSGGYNGPASGSDEAWAVAVDSSGNPVVAGMETVTGQGFNWLVRKYDASGALLWSRTYNGPANGDDFACGVAVDGSGNAYVAGVETRTDVGQGRNWLVRKYDASGNLLWSQGYNGAANLADEADACAVDGNGDVVVGGMETVTGQGMNWLIRKYAAGGTLVWSVTHSSPGSTDDYVMACAVPADGHALIAAGTATRADLGQSQNWLIRRYVTMGLGVAASVSASVISVGEWSRVALTVTNTGCTDLVNVTPALAMGPGAALAAVLDGPTPPFAGSLAPGASATFAWTVSGSAAGTVHFTLTAVGVDTGLSGTVTGVAAADLVIQLPRKRILFYGPDAGGLAATTPGITITVWNEATWATKTTADFAAFDAIVFGDQPACHASATIWDAAIATRDVWSLAVTGNVILMGASPDAAGKSELVHQAVLFAAERGAPATGLYASLSCAYEGAAPVAVDLLAGLGDFTTAAIGATVCVDAAHKVADHPALAAIDDAYLSNWGCSTREGFLDWPAGYMPLAVALWGTVWTACDGTAGTPYLLASGVAPSCPTPVVHKTVSPDRYACGDSVLTYRVAWSNAGAATVYGLTLTDTLPAGLTVVAPSFGSWLGADWLGVPAVTASAWAASVAGPWTPGEPPDATAPPVILRWVVNRVAPGQSGWLEFRASVASAVPVATVIANRASATQAGDCRVYDTEEAAVYRGAVELTMTPSAWAVTAGAPVTYTIAFGNACLVTAANLALWDTLPPGTVFVAASDGGVFDGTKVDWSLPSLDPGMAGFVTLTVSVTGASAPVGPNVARLDYTDPPGTPLSGVTSNTVWVDVVWGLPVVHKSVEPPGEVCAGSILAYTLSWSNAGVATVLELVLLDTLPGGVAWIAPSVVYTAGADGWGTPAPAASAYAASAAGPWTAGEPPDGAGSPLVLRWIVDRVAPGATGSLQFQVRVSSTLSTGTVIANAALATMANGATTYATEAASSTVVTAGVLEVAAASTPRVSVGQWVTVCLTVTNTGGSAVDGIMPDVAAGPGAELVVPESGPSPPGPVTLAPGSATTFTWTFSASGAGLAGFTATASGSTCAGTAVLAATAASTTIQVPARLDATLIAWPASVCAGGSFLVTLTVTNTGEADATGVASEPLLETGGAAAPGSGPSPAFPVILPGGGAMTFTWTYAGTAPGVSALTATVTGADANSGAPLTTGPVQSGTVAVLAPGTLEAAASAPVAVSTGEWFQVTVTATNTGAAGVTGVVAALAAGPGAALLSAALGPEPPGPVTLAGLAAQTFVWSFTATGTGPVVFSATVAGVTCGSTALTATALVASTVQAPAALGATLTVLADGVCIGDTFLVTLTVTNAGEAAAAGVTPAIGGEPGVVFVAGPWPAPPAGVPGGGSVVFTWTLSGASPGAAGFTATVTGTDADSGAAIATGPLTAGPVTVRAPGVLVSAASAGLVVSAGQWLTVALTVTNEGGSDVRNVTPSIAVGPGAGLVAPESAPSGPLTLTAGGATTFAWTWSAAGAGLIRFTMTASGDTCEATVLLATGSVSATVQVPASLEAALRAFPSPRDTGQGFLVTLTVTNTGQAGATSVAPAMPFASGTGAAVLADGPFPSIPVPLAGGAAVTFTWTYVGTAPGWVDFTTTVTAADANAGWPLAAGPAASGSVLIQAPAALQASLACLSATVCAGGTVLVTLTVTNTGGAAASLVTTAAFRASGGGTASPVAGPFPAMPASLSGGASAVFTWTFSGASPGALTLSTTVSGADANTGGGLSTGPVPAAAIAVVLPPTLAVSASVPAAVVTGQWLTVGVTVTNTGGSALFGATPAIAAGPGAGLVVPVSAPSGPLTLAPGGATTFAWTWSASGTGSVTFTMTVAGAGACGPAQVSATTTTTVETPAGLQASLVAAPTRVSVGQAVRVTLTVTNTGGGSANLAAAPVQPDGPFVTWSSGPTPAFPAVLAGGASRTFTWVFQAAAPGGLDFTATLAGTDAVSGLPLSPGMLVSGTVLIQTPALLRAALAVYSTTVCTGTGILVTLTLTNTGQADAAGVATPAPAAIGAGAAAVAGPLPPFPAVVPGGTAMTFTWTFTGSTSGRAIWTVTPAGTDANSGAAVAAPAAAGPSWFLTSAAFGLSIGAPATVAIGQCFTAVLPVTNTGGSAATGVSPVLAVSPALGAVAGPTGPAPPGPVTLAPGDTVGFVWTFTATGPGVVTLTFTVTGVSACGPATASLVRSITVQAGPVLSASLVATPSVAGVDAVISVVMTVSNTGGMTVNGVSPTAIAVTGDGGVAWMSGPQPVGATILPGTCRAFTWTYRTMRGGTVTFRAGATGANAPLVAPVASNPVVIVEAGGSLVDGRIFPNPFHWRDALGGTLKFRHLPPFTEIRLYSTAAELIRRLTADVNGSAAWDGKNTRGAHVAAGVYFYVFEAPSGSREIGKIQVKP